MRSQTPSLAPDEPHDVTVYIVLNDFGELGRAYVETDEAKADDDCRPRLKLTFALVLKRDLHFRSI